MSRILVAGSYNESMTAVTPTLPRMGETVLGTASYSGPGGKGANQAIGCARLGTQTTFLVKLGRDAFGDAAQRLLIAEGLPPQAILRTDEANTGVALIMVDHGGNNQIAVVPGANALLTGSDAPPEIYRDVAVLLCQLECPPELFESLARSLPGARKILNPAPAQWISDRCCALVDFLTPNESELAMLTGLPVTTEQEVAIAAAALVNRGVGNVIATLGENGALWFDGRRNLRFPTPAVSVVDTTGAGDAFNAGLAHALALDLPVTEAIELAVQCGAYCVTQPGVIDGLPRPEDLPQLTTSRPSRQP